MANLHNAANHSSSSSPEEPDDFSLFLQQIMLRSSSSSSGAPSSGEFFRPTYGGGPPGNQDCALQSLLLSGPDRVPLSGVSSGAGLQWSSACGFFASPGTCLQEGAAVNVSSSVSVGTVDNDLNECDCESEGFEGVVDEAMGKPTAGRSSSKRSRAAEVHNLSEKRRRSRINEKMKALQNLIPNSNKTDKASMLDEAIDYLKQLQLQVQLLTLRNGLSLYPMCLPGMVQSNQLSKMRMGYEGNKSSNMSSAAALPANPAMPTNILFSLPDDYDSHKRASILDSPKLNDTEHSLAQASAISGLDGTSFPFPLPGPSTGVFMEKKLHIQQSSKDLFRSKTSVGEYMGSEATGSVVLNARAAGLEEDILGGALLANLECIKVPQPEVDG